MEYIDRLKELVAGERASIEATKREMEREQQEQAEERRRRDTGGSVVRCGRSGRHRRLDSPPRVWFMAHCCIMPQHAQKKRVLVCVVVPCQGRVCGSGLV